jgi:hypothetical protein
LPFFFLILYFITLLMTCIIFQTILWGVPLLGILLEWRLDLQKQFGEFQLSFKISPQTSHFCTL